MDTHLDSLDPSFKPLAILLLARLVEARIAVVITNTRRTTREQQMALAAGNSKVAHSAHQDGLAMDVCPWETYTLSGPNKLQWDTSDDVWLRIGRIGEALGLRWGGRFHPLNAKGIGWDPGHFELQTPPPVSGAVHA